MSISLPFITYRPEDRPGERLGVDDAEKRLQLTDDEERTAILAKMVAEMRRSGVSPVRRFVIELGCEIVSAKARVLARLCSQLKRELQVKRRATSQPKQSRIAAVTGAAGK